MVKRFTFALHTFHELRSAKCKLRIGETVPRTNVRHDDFYVSCSIAVVGGQHGEMGASGGSEKGKGHVLRKRVGEIGQREGDVVELFGESGTFVGAGERNWFHIFILKENAKRIILD